MPRNTWTHRKQCLKKHLHDLLRSRGSHFCYQSCRVAFPYPEIDGNKWRKKREDTSFTQKGRLLS
ncbi:unnamed protein product [Amoebophrya sp. A25]|nr:unnamed protein product [Amoebophrya sp. A25]|eukprot:GSA25T00001336001.1